MVGTEIAECVSDQNDGQTPTESQKILKASAQNKKWVRDKALQLKLEETMEKVW